MLTDARTDTDRWTGWFVYKKTQNFFARALRSISNPETKTSTAETEISTTETKILTAETEISTPETKISTPETKISTPDKAHFIFLGIWAG